MGKRSTFDRVAGDFYPTPSAAVAPLIPHLPEEFTFAEPCAGAGDLVRHLEAQGGKCLWQSDIEPRARNIRTLDAREFTIGYNTSVDFIITNPPWKREILHELIDNFADQRPTWLLFDADWMHTRQAAPYLWMLVRIVSVGRQWRRDVGQATSC